MLRNIKSLRGFILRATDGEIGRALDFYFDDEHWTVRYLVVDTGAILPGRKVLLSPIAIEGLDWDEEEIRLRLTQEQVRRSPGPESDAPPTRREEEAYHRFFDWAGYWGMGTGVWGGFGLPGMLAQHPWTEPVKSKGEQEAEAQERRREDPHLRSVNDSLGYGVRETDDDLGHVTDLIVDDASWTLRYLVVDTSRWWFGKHVLVSTRWVDAVRWDERKVLVSLTREAIRTSPAWRPDMPITREYEEQLHRHYARPGYWTEPEQIQKRPEQTAIADEEAPSRPYPTDHDTHPWMS